MNKNKSALVGGLIGAVAAYPLSYFFQPSALRAKISLGKYIEGFSEVINSKDLSSTVFVSFVIFVIIGMLVGAIIGRAKK